MTRLTICGIDQCSGQELRRRLYFDPNLFFGKRWIFDIVIEILRSNVTDVCGDDQPFILLAYTPDNTIHSEIADILHKNKIEFEKLELKGFVAEKKQLNSKTVFAAIWERPLGVTRESLVSLFTDQQYSIRALKTISGILKQLVGNKAVELVEHGKYKAGVQQLKIFLKNCKGGTSDYFADPNSQIWA